MKAGFATVDITPDIGTPMMGWGMTRDRLATGIHDPIEICALSVEHDGQEVVIVTYDFCFIGKGDALRIQGLLCRDLGLRPDQVMLCTTHTHAAPAMGYYLDLMYEAPLYDYLDRVDAGTVQAVRQARENHRPATMSSGCGKSQLPVNRRKLVDGQIVNGPNPGGPVHDDLPVCQFTDETGKPICILFSIATHPVCFSGTEVSADYPGIARRELDKQIGTTCAMFVQGPGGDSRPRTLIDGEKWVGGPGSSHTTQTAQILVEETLGVLKTLEPIEPGIRSSITLTHWPLQSNLDEAAYQTRADADNRVYSQHAKDQLALLKAGRLPTTAPIVMQLFELSPQLRIVAIEGEPLHPYGQICADAFDTGHTWTVGYANGEGMYLVTSPMLDEGGYEPVSFWEYHMPSPLAKGMEQTCIDGVATLKANLR